MREVLETGNLAYIYGHHVTRFEERFAGLMGAEYAVAVSSGTAALHTAMIYLNPDPGDEILVSPITDMGAVIPVLYQQAIPIFVDVDPLNQNMNPAEIEQLLTPRTRALMVTHMFGSPADMDPVLRIAVKHDLFVIEDCAQAHMAEYRGRKVGTLGNMGCFSFQQSKHITTGDGGMVISNEDDQFGRSLRLCFDKGWPRSSDGRDHLFLAPNYHMTELQAAVGLAQCEKYGLCISRRREAAAQLDEMLRGLEGIRPLATLPECKQTYFSYCFRLDPARFRVDAETVVRALRAEGLCCELGYPGQIPLYLYSLIREKKTLGSSGWPFDSPAARGKQVYEPGLCPQAERACRETVVLPWNEGLESSHVDQIGGVIEKVAGAYSGD